MVFGDITCNISGSGSLEAGTVHSINGRLTVNGTSNITLNDGSIETLHTKSSGIGNIKCGNVGNADFNASGVGAITLAQQPTGTVRSHRSGLGKIRIKSSRT